MKRRWIYWLLFGAFIWLVVSRFSEFTTFSQTLAQGRLLWVAVAVALQVLQYVVSSASYRTAFTTVGVESRIRDLFPLYFGAIFINVIAPAGGASGAALFLDNAARRGQSPTKAAAGILLQLVISMIAFMMILIVGLVYLGTRQGLQTYHVAAAVILVISIAVEIGVLLLALRHPELLKRVLDWVQRVVNGVMMKIKRMKLLSDEWVEERATEFGEAAAAITANPRGLLYTLGVLLFAHVVNIAGLYALFLAFSQSISIGSLVAGYAVGILFLIVSVTPQGIGVVEGVMPLVFNSLGVPHGISTVTVFAFRGLSFWLPLVVGFLLLRRTGVFRTRKPIVSKE